MQISYLPTFICDNRHKHVKYLNMLCYRFTVRWEDTCGEASSMAQWLPGELDLSSMSMYYNYYLPQVRDATRGAPGARGAHQHQTGQGDHAHCSTLCSIFRCLRSISWIDLTSHPYTAASFSCIPAPESAGHTLGAHCACATTYSELSKQWQ